MPRTQKLNYFTAEKYATNLWRDCEKQTDSRLVLSNRMFGLVLLMGLETGARISDLLNMEYSNISEMEGKPNVFTITYRVEKSDVDHRWLISANLKSKIEITREWIKTRYGYYGNYIFYNPMNEGMFTRVWASKRISKANKLGELGSIIDVAGSHSLRKASAHRLFEKSGDLRLVQAQLKHRNITTTSKYLGLEEKEALEKAIAVMGY